MNDPIEERLVRMQPAPVPNEVMARLITARPQPATPPPLPGGLLPAWWRELAQWTFAVGLLAAAVAFAILAFKKIQTNKIALAMAPVPQPTRVFLPVEQRNYLVRTDDLGIVAADSANPVRLVRAVWVDDATFRGADGISSARLTQPREQIIPVALEIY